ncbi:UNVERIFIED_CONTAM: Disease resistance RPP8-like protein 3 [Sesamum radiatum]|uniref:Disease resistance RPP8-like protein 3 n=1 Tax=Sesamum radiatum TaxID=300843 RepID=A0AAW2PKD5_SESRA
MAVAAYASLRSLMQVLDNVQHPFRRSQLRFDTDRVQSLQQKLQFLVDFFEHHSQRMSQEMEDLAGQIVAAADEAEDFIDIHVVDQLRQGSEDESYHLAVASSFYQDLDRVIEKIDSITNELMMIEEEWGNIREPVVSNLPINSTTLPSSDKNTMIGFNEQLLRVMDELTRDEPNLQILPVVGMGGTGKTTLARNIFDHPYVVHHFDKRIWFTISQEYSVHEILVRLLNDGTDQEVSEAKLGERLYKSLFGERYLIVMDDVWSVEAWDALKLFFPNKRNGSRVMITTRLANVADSLGSQKPYLMNFLDEDESWNLFCHKAFLQGDCPYLELEKIGRNIAKACRGLPLAIVVIGGLLANSKMEQEYWMYVAKNVTSFVNSEDNEHCLKILALSYENLPIHLKPCFLYMRVFCEDDEIEISKLTKLWIGEGFLKSKRGKTLEEVAKEYLKNLVDRNLVLIRKWTKRGKPRVCGIHDLLRDLCLKEADKEHFIRNPKVQQIYPYKGNGIVCLLCSDRVSLQETINVPEIVVGSQLTSGTGGLVCEACKRMYPNLVRLRWVKVFSMFNREYLQYTKLRYIEMSSYTPWSNIMNDKFISPFTMPLLWNMQTLFFTLSITLGPIIVPPKIWEMPQLRHVIIKSAILPNPIDTQDSPVLENLQTLSFIHDFICTKEVLHRIPNLKKLKICYLNKVEDWSCYCFYNLVHLHKLQTLLVRAKDLLLKNIAFPTSLKKLELGECKVPWKDMTIIGSLSNLEVLILRSCAFEGSKWNPIKGQFSRLKVLTLSVCNLVFWRVENIHFPNLEMLSLSFMYDLEEIPSGVGDIATLRLIEVENCSESIVKSAMQILEEQQSNGNEDLQVRFDYY